MGGYWSTLTRQSKQFQDSYTTHTINYSTVACSCDTPIFAVGIGFEGKIKRYLYVQLGTHLSMWRSKASRICHCVLVYTTNCAAEKRLGLPHVLHISIHWLSVHQSEPKPSMRRGCFFHVFILDLAEENAQLFFDKARQTAAHRARFSTQSQIQHTSICHGTLHT